MMTGHELWVEDDKRQEREMWRERAALAKKRISDSMAKMQRATFRVIEPAAEEEDFSWLTRCNHDGRFANALRQRELAATSG